MPKERTYFDMQQYIEKYYKLEKIVVKHFNVNVGYGYVATHPDGTVYHAINEKEEKALDELFIKLPDSSLREGHQFIDSNRDVWTVVWDCGEKVQLKKINKIILDDKEYQEELMVYIYKGFEFMSFDYRLYDKVGERTSSKKVPLEYKKVVDEVVEACQDQQKFPNYILKKPDVWKQFKQ